MEDISARVQTVSEITRSVRGLLETEFPFVTVIGEISSLRRPYSGHLYFILKDRDAQLRAVLFRSQQRYLVQEPEDGMEVVCRGRISVYEPRGEYQLIVDVMDLQSTGMLRLAFERLKDKLAREGLFDEGRKKTLPFMPRRISVVTSPNGAAVHDFLKIAKSRAPSVRVEIFPVRVQGEGAADDIAEALEVLNRRGGTQVIVLCRGGGSVEDLWAFNEEKLARAVYASEIPVVSAVGHEVDFTIADFVADYRAPTPTAAAGTILPDEAALREKIAAHRERIAGCMTRKIVDYRRLVKSQRSALGDPGLLLDHYMLVTDQVLNAMVHVFMRGLRVNKLRVQQNAVRLARLNPVQRLDYQKKRGADIVGRFGQAACLFLEKRRMRLAAAVKLLEAVNPRAVLSRGYSIVSLPPSGEIIRKNDQVGVNQLIEILLHQGKLAARVTDSGT